MRRVFLFIFVGVLLFSLSFKSARAIYDPLNIPNNKIGIHILFPTELQKAKELVNSSGGDWGYVTIPIQAGDKDIDKWQGFMDECRRLHLIPILRLATEGDYFDKTTWRKPKESDVLDFANFLSSLDWPVKNRYIVVFNEVNRADEWNGSANPGEYAGLLSYAVSIFKQKSPDYFIISAGLDNAAANSGGSYNEYDFLDLMEQSNPGVFTQIDGMASHSYPNPGFAQPPRVRTRESITSFSYEQREIEQFSGKKLPVFITETGWSRERFPDSDIGTFFKDALSGVWNSSDIVAITPFLLDAGPGPFSKFSFLAGNGEKTDIYKAYEGYPKQAGKPNLYPIKLLKLIKNTLLPVKNFSGGNVDQNGQILKDAVKWLFFGF